MKTLYVTERINGKQAKVCRGAADDEFVVKFYANGKHMDAADLLFNSRDDAISTANHAIEAEREWVPCVLRQEYPQC